MKNNRVKSVLKIILAVFSILYVLAVIKIVFEFGVRLETSKIKLIPFSGIREYNAGLKSLTAILLNYAGNVALFFPAGLILPVYFNRLKLWSTAAVGAGLSLLIEVMQYVLKCGYSDVDDILMNTGGAALGAVVYLYILGGRKKTVLSLVLALVIVITSEVGGIVGVWMYAPYLLPSDMIVMGGMVAGRDLDDFDYSVTCYKMSHGEVFIKSGSVLDKNKNPVDKRGSFFIADTAIFVVDDGGSYSVVGLDEMIAAVAAKGESTVRLWLNNDGRCKVIMLEKNSTAERNTNENR